MSVSRPDPQAAADRLERLAQMLTRTGLFIEDAPEVVGELRRDVAVLVAECDALRERDESVLADVTSLRRELVTIFGVPTQRNGETWNAAMLRLIAEKLIEVEAERDALRATVERQREALAGKADEPCLFTDQKCPDEWSLGGGSEHEWCASCWARAVLADAAGSGVGS